MEHCEVIIEFDTIITNNGDKEPFELLFYCNSIDNYAVLLAMN